MLLENAKNWMPEAWGSPRLAGLRDR